MPPSCLAFYEEWEKRGQQLESIPLACDTMRYYPGPGNIVIQAVKDLIKRTVLYDIIWRIRQEKEVRRWEQGGKPIPPPHFVKEKIVKEYAKEFSIHILIETGTYHGDMAYAVKDICSSIFTIELDRVLYRQAKMRLSWYRHISVIQGDSRKVLPSILANITQPCLFWLDAHYSGEGTAKGELNTPIIKELHCILDHPVTSVVLIDDARCFVGEDDYPTIDELRDLIFKKHPDWVFEVEDDIIRIHKRRGT